MKNKGEIFINCDDLDNIPDINRENYILEHDFLVEKLPRNTSVLQVGSMDGLRAVRILQARPDLSFSGLEIEEALVKRARKNTTSKNVEARFIEGDITGLQEGLSHFDYVICLNNTLGFIPEYKKAIKNMRRLGGTVFVSVFSEKFDDDMAKKYFKSIGLDVREIKDNKIILKDFTTVNRFTKHEIESWAEDLAETPLGYFCELK